MTHPAIPPARGRFAPSPTGPLHMGSLVAAAGSWLHARHARGEWLVRIEDLDGPRVVPGSEAEILRALERYALHWDGPVVRQSERSSLYQGALDALRAAGKVYDCSCSRAEIARAASAPASSDPVEPAAAVYPGTCRNGMQPGRTPRAVRFALDPGEIRFHDLAAGAVTQNVLSAAGDFVVRRADGVFAYQIAVVVDDAAQAVSQVVRGRDLLESTPRQIALQRALGYVTPQYAHLPLVINPDGSKLGKRDRALPLALLEERLVVSSLASALRILGVLVEHDTPERMLSAALEIFDPSFPLAAEAPLPG